MTTPLRIVALGGLGEVGMNCTVVEHGSRRFLIDCGMTFSDQEYGIDTIVPCFDHLVGDAERPLEAVVLTHGHEDHIGALPYLLSALPVPVHGPPHALSLVRERLSEHDLPHPPDLRPFSPRQPFEVCGVEIEPYRVTHSIPDCTGLVMRCGAGVVVHSGDFRIDDDPVDGEHFDREFLREVGDAGVRALLSDSTNITVPRTIGSEREVAATLGAMIAQAKGRVVVSMFASNVYRLRAVIDAARATGRRIALLGRSLQTHARIGTELGWLPPFDSLLVPAEEAQRFPPEQLIVAATGSQGEPRAALSRLARDQHHLLRLSPGDTVILSARIIPGKEPHVYELIDDLLRMGVDVVQRADNPAIHVSGHASRAEQQELIELLRPQTFIPVHGTRYHLTRHAALATSLGVPETVVVENGTPVTLEVSRTSVGDAFEVLPVPTQELRPMPGVVLRDRKLLARVGICVASVVLDAAGRPTGTPRLLTRGVIHEDASDALLSEAREAAERELQAENAPWTVEAAVETVSRSLRQTFKRALGYRPSIHCIVSQLD